MKKIFKMFFICILGIGAFGNFSNLKANEVAQKDDFTKKKMFDNLVKKYEKKLKAKNIILSIIDLKNHTDLAQNFKFEPGPALYPALMAIALENKLIDEKGEIYIGKNGYKIMNFKIPEEHFSGRSLDYKQILKLYSNIGFAKLGQMLDEKKYREWFGKLDLDLYDNKLTSLYKSVIFLGHGVLATHDDLMNIYAKLTNTTIFSKDTNIKIKNALKQTKEKYNSYRYNGTAIMMENKRYVKKYIYSSFGEVENDTKRYIIGISVINTSSNLSNRLKLVDHMLNELTKEIF